MAICGGIQVSRQVSPFRPQYMRKLVPPIPENSKSSVYPSYSRLIGVWRLETGVNWGMWSHSDIDILDIGEAVPI